MAQSQQWFRPGGQSLLNNATQLNHFQQRIRDFAQALPGRLRALEAWRILQSAVAGKELDSVVAGKELDSRIVAKVDFELRKLGGARGLTDEGLPEAFSSEDSVSGSANIHVTPSEEASEDWMRNLGVDLARPVDIIFDRVTSKAADSDVESVAADADVAAVIASAAAVFLSAAEADLEGSEISAALVGELLDDRKIFTALVGDLLEEQEAEEKRKKIRMLEFQQRCAADVRWCALGVAHPDPFIENFLKTMLSDVRTPGVALWDAVWAPMLTPSSEDAVSCPANTYDRCANFLREARSRHLQMTTLALPGNESILQEKQFFFSKLPHISMEEDGGCLDESVRSKYEAVKRLVNYHNGELVEVRQDMMGKWMLIPKSHEDLPEQFDLHKNEEEAKKYSPPQLSRCELITLEVQMKEVAGSWPVSDSRSVWSLQPDFKGQRNRLMVPCVGTSEYVCVRARSVITLGKLFVQLHQKYTARCLLFVSPPGHRQHQGGGKRW